jgi:arylsulfatase
MLLSGTDAHLGGLGVLIEYKRSESGAKRFGGKAGYEGYLNNDVATIPEVLQDNGYFTAMSGKVSGFRSRPTSDLDSLYL